MDSDDHISDISQTDLLKMYSYLGRLGENGVLPDSDAFILRFRQIMSEKIPSGIDYQSHTSFHSDMKIALFLYERANNLKYPLKFHDFKDFHQNIIYRGDLARIVANGVEYSYVLIDSVRPSAEEISFSVVSPESVNQYIANAFSVHTVTIRQDAFTSFETITRANDMVLRDFPVGQRYMSLQDNQVYESISFIADSVYLLPIYLGKQNEDQKKCKVISFNEFQSQVAHEILTPVVKPQSFIFQSWEDQK